MQLFDEIRAHGGKITSFKSHCGGLVAPESDDNPWHYKISWNPRNIVMAGAAGAAYKENDQLVQKTYNEVFEKCKKVVVDDLPAFAWYPNRDSLSYMPLYGLEDTSTFIRTTLRYADFCKGWDVVIDLDLTNKHDHALVSKCKTFNDWFNAKLLQIEGRELSLRMYLELYVAEADHDIILAQFSFLALDENVALPANAKCSADILQSKVEQKLALQPTDQDMIVMLHEIDYELNGETKTINSSLVVKGEDSLRTAMAKTVGLPLGIAAKLILEEKIRLKGLHIPTNKEIYGPVLEELKQHNIIFKEQRN
jgi:saccharopine dehydrogenase-like NADP-dependent oxidoreductase